MGIKVKIGIRQMQVPPGEYNVKLVDLREGTFNGKRKIYEFFFEIADGQYVGVVLRGFINAHYESFSEYTKLFQWASQITKDLGAGESLDLNLFFDKILRVLVENTKSRKTGNGFSNVTEILGVVCDLDGIDAPLCTVGSSDSGESHGHRSPVLIPEPRPTAPPPTPSPEVQTRRATSPQASGLQVVGGKRRRKRSRRGGSKKLEWKEVAAMTSEEG